LRAANTKDARVDLEFRSDGLC